MSTQTPPTSTPCASGPPSTLSGDKSGSQESLHDSTQQPGVQLNGGFVAWSQVLVSHLIVINGFGYFSSFALFQAHWTTTLSKNASEISWVGSISLFLLFFLGTLSGKAMDAGHFRSLLILGCSFQIVAVFSTSFVTQYWQLLLSQGVAQGIGNGLLFTPCVALVSTYFTKFRAFALSLAACGAPVGGIVFPVLSRQLAPRIGYPWAIRIMGFVILFNCVVIVLLARPRSFTQRKGQPLIDVHAFKEPTYLLFAVGIFFTLWGVYIAYFYTTTFGRNVIHISEAQSLTLLMILNGVGIPGRLIPAYVADRRFGSFTTLLPFVGGAAVMLFGWIGVRSEGAFYAFVILYGICSNAVQTLFPSALSQLTTDLSKMASRVGMVFTVGSFACLTGPPIAGALIDVGEGDYLYAQLFGGCSVVLGLAFLSAARWCQRQERRRVQEQDCC
ncbi:mfs monocarboxylate transporter [Diplodia corticola]|uniref:Mfs monocarboxylate transporter n=1 Tax=Diplodia corticola TaxID=236234 RepID=A0A1J9RM22_9PEZI|nr:mfs monocarboxylate transporter [Diplodia corticola]OJD28972.1 mfs monocarboxylate transporter [Diplodia corticola]